MRREMPPTGDNFDTRFNSGYYDDDDIDPITVQREPDLGEVDTEAYDEFGMPISEESAYPPLTEEDVDDGSIVERAREDAAGYDGFRYDEDELDELEKESRAA